MKYWEEMNIRRGDIFYINNNRGQIGSEMKKDRPAIIVSNNISNKYSKEVTVIFLTTKAKTQAPTHVKILSTGRKSVALCEAPTTIDKMRVNNYVGHCSRQEMTEVGKALKIAMDI